jgi:predicted RNase H-like HicB family nuclease
MRVIMRMNNYGFNIQWSDEDQGYIAVCPEFPGLSAFGETAEQALSEAKTALDLFLKVYKDDDIPIPEPQHVEHYSGQFRVRISHSLHRQAAQVAEREGVSLNQLIVGCISEAVGLKRMFNGMMQEMTAAISSISSRTGLAFAAHVLSSQGTVQKIEKTVTTQSVETVQTDWACNRRRDD